MRRARKAKKPKTTTDESERLKLCANDRGRFLVLAGSFESPSRGLGFKWGGRVRAVFTPLLCFALLFFFFFYIALLKKKKKSFSTAARLGQQRTK